MTSFERHVRARDFGRDVKITAVDVEDLGALALSNGHVKIELEGRCVFLSNT